jgi:hypothetical protein
MNSAAQLMNGDLRDTFQRWYPGMKAGSEDPLSSPPDLDLVIADKLK